MAIGSGKVVSCGIRWNTRRAVYRVRVTVQQFTSAGGSYVYHSAYVNDWPAALAWFAQFP